MRLNCRRIRSLPTPVIKTDGSGTLTVTDAAEYEIIIGNCKRDGVSIISDPDKYEIRIEDKKIFLNGGSAHATAFLPFPSLQR